MTEVYLHVGLHKTGTSAIQHYLNNERGALLAPGVFYPAMDGTDAHHGLAGLMLKKDGKHKVENGTVLFLEKFPKCVANAVDRKLVIGSEIFSESIDFDVFKNISTAHCQVKIILYLRRQDLLIESASNQILKQNGTLNENILCPRLYTTDFYQLSKK